MAKRKLKKRKIFAVSILLILAIGFLLPQNLIIPVENATSSDWNDETFWYYPWGKSVTHKGIDVFAEEGTNILSAGNGIVVGAGEIGLGGNYVLVLGAKWRLHYYAHCKDVYVGSFSFVKKGEAIATVGATGNAVGKQPHLHYSIVSLIPYPWRIDGDRQGWKKMFYLNPFDHIPEG